MLAIDFGLADPLKSMSTLKRLAFAGTGTASAVFALAFVKLVSLPLFLAFPFAFATLLGSQPRRK